jgi:error-prone DNA polymerase
MSYNEFPKLRPHPGKDDAWREASEASVRAGSVAYCELNVRSNSTFLVGASHPEELVQRAHVLGHKACAIADGNTLAGVVRAHVAAKALGLPLCVGSRLELRGCEGKAPLRTLLCYPTCKASYARLSTLLTIGKRRAPKGQCWLSVHDVLEHIAGQLLIALPPETIDDEYVQLLQGLRAETPDLWVGVGVSHDQHDAVRCEQMRALAQRVGVGLVAQHNVLYHDASRRPLQDVLTCIRHGCTLREAGQRLERTGERCLRSGEEMLRFLVALGGMPEAAAREAVEASVAIAARASAFSLDALRYAYPSECAPGQSATQLLRERVEAGIVERYGVGWCEPVAAEGRGEQGAGPEGRRALRNQIEYELAMIAELGYEPYFLTCEEIVRFARSRGIMCQGRGGAANSAVCFVLGITEVDPTKFCLLFERFISRERREPPDIDIDFEHERREEVIQHIYAKYGREHAALTAEVVTYRGRSAVREVGKVFGLSQDAIGALAKSMDFWGESVSLDMLRTQGHARYASSGDAGLTARVLGLARELIGFPRHLSQHVGGFVITREPLHELVPIENAAMEHRTVIEWDKDDIDAMGMLKVDVLGLGMLTCVGKAMRMVEGGRGKGMEGWREEGMEGGQGRYGEPEGVEHEGALHGIDQHVSRSCGVAAQQGVGSQCVSLDRGDATERDLRAARPDAACGGLGAIEHRGGIRKADHARVSSQPSDCERLTRGACDADGDRARTEEHDAERRAACECAVADRGDREDAVCDHAQARSPTQDAIARASSSSLLPCFPPSLHLSRLSDIPWDDVATYDMICAADTIGVFQIESRAQMSMLPRLRPRCFYDLVIEVAIVRPGPIQGGMVHPYLRRRNGEEAIVYPSEAVREVLERTLGVPLFQEQAMRLAIVAAGFTPDQADGLRRAMASWKRKGDLIYRYGQKLMEGMVRNGYPQEFAERCFEQIKGFSEYGFPESHAASFALLVYASAWLKRHHPAAFAAALINSQHMGFYAPAQIVRDAEEHGVEVRGVDVCASGWDCGLEAALGKEVSGEEVSRCRGIEVSRENTSSSMLPSSLDTLTPRHLDTSSLDTSSLDTSSLDTSTPRHLGTSSVSPALRLGLRLVRGLRQQEAEAVARCAREHASRLRGLGEKRALLALWRMSGVSVRTMRLLAKADAFGGLGLERQQALWQVRAMRDEELPLFDGALMGGQRAGESARDEARDEARDKACDKARDKASEEASDALPAVPEALGVLHDYAAIGLSRKGHPMRVARAALRAKGVVRTSVLRDAARLPNGARVRVAGLVLVRQRPGTASGVLFVTLEDEVGIANLIVWPKVYERFKRDARLSAALMVEGSVQREGEVVHVVVRRLRGIDSLLGGVRQGSRDFR